MQLFHVKLPSFIIIVLLITNDPNILKKKPSCPINNVYVDFFSLVSIPVCYGY